MAADDEIDVQPGDGVWMTKQGEGLGGLAPNKRRYFVLVFAQRARTLRMAYFAELAGSQPVDRKGAVPVSTLSTIASRGREIKIVS